MLKPKLHHSHGGCRRLSYATACASGAPRIPARDGRDGRDVQSLELGSDAVACQYGAHVDLERADAAAAAATAEAAGGGSGAYAPPPAAVAPAADDDIDDDEAATVYA